MADDETSDRDLRLDDALDYAKQQLEEEQAQENLRTDLFGEDDEDAIAPHSQAEAETRLPSPEQEGQSGAEEHEPASQREEFVEHSLEDRESPGVAEEPQQQQGRHDDIFGSESEDEGQQQRGHASEAEDEDEEDEFEAMFKTGKKRKRKSQAHEIVMTVETLIANMEVAAEMDITANEEGKPAVNKIKMLPQVEDKLSQTMLHRELLDGGILGALKLWIELLPNGSLPNVKVRTAVLKMLQKLPIDLSLEGRKEQLKKSELGKYVMFYSKLPDETLPNRQLARSLVEKWSRPVFEQYRERGQEEELQEREEQLARYRKKRRQEAAAAAPKEETEKGLKPGDAGFRWHARMPAPARLDYMRLPQSSVAAGEGEAVKGKAKPKDRMSKKLAAMSRKGGAKAGSGKVSLQGRGLLL